MKDTDPMKVEILYGMQCMRPEVHVEIVAPPPLKWYQVLYYGAIEYLISVVLPAFLFAIAWTLLIYTARG